MSTQVKYNSRQIMHECFLKDGGKVLVVKANNKVARFHSIWLRDNSRDETTLSPQNQQKLITLNDIPKSLKISSLNLDGNHIELVFQPENKRVSFDVHWLLKNNYDYKITNIKKGWVNDKIVLWDSDMTSTLPSINFDKFIQSDFDLWRWLDKFLKYGFGKIIDSPEKQDTLFELVKRFGYVRETNYGRKFEVRSIKNPSNLAYTSKGLAAHTDNPYRDPVLSLQILYSIENSATGGESVVVDGFNAALKLKDENLEMFNVLSTHNVSFQFSGEEGICLKADKPMLELAPNGELKTIRFNNRSTIIKNNLPFDTMELFYDPYRKFGKIISDKSMQFSFSLKPGECFIVDNTRVLHARNEYMNDGNRWLQGCYSDKDGLLSKYEVLNLKYQNKC